jgi:hypothetical protein
MWCAQSFTDFKVIVSGYVDELEFLTWIKVADLMLKHFASIDAEIEVRQLLWRNCEPQGEAGYHVALIRDLYLILAGHPAHREDQEADCTKAQKRWVQVI